MKFRLKPLAIATALVGITLITGCGGSGQDSSSTNSTVGVGGLALDGYLARARVFQDLNENGVIDGFEPTAFTDDEGYYSYNPISDTNYCAQDASDAQKKLCLRLAPATDSVIVIQGGYDLLVGAPFHGSMRARVDIPANRPANTVDIVSPVTTILSHAQTEAQKTRIKTLLGIDDEDLTRDYYNRQTTGQAGDASADLNLMKVTQVLHKSVSAAAQLLEAGFTDLGEEADIPTDATFFVYDALADVLLDENLVSEANLATTSVEDVIGSTSNLNTMISAAKTALETAIQNASLVVPTGPATDPTSTENTRLIGHIADLPDVIKSVVDSLPDTTAPTSDTASGELKAIEIALNKIVDGQSDAEIQRTNSLLSDDNSTVRDTLLDELENAGVSVSQLTETNFDFADSAAVIAATDVDYDPIFDTIGGKRLVAGEVDTGEQKDILAIIYFTAESVAAESVAAESVAAESVAAESVASESESAESESVAAVSVAAEPETLEPVSDASRGSISACIRYVDGLDANGQLDSSGTLGEFTEAGTFASIAGGYSVMLNLELAGAQLQVSLAYNGTNDAGEHLYSTDFEDELTQWSGDAIPQTPPLSNVAPTDDESCITALNAERPVAFSVTE